ncbi:MAG: hypothetical protein MK160_03410, partial [Rhodobacteraceae bacterium]|nr:hypothetical protein [Paracoccaceae bacterium]
EQVVLFGYSGFDDHLNLQIRRLADGKLKRIIERTSPNKSEQNRVAFWEEKLGENIEVILLKNVLSFTGWESPD